MTTERRLFEAVLAFLAERETGLAADPLAEITFPLPDGSTLRVPVVLLAEAQ